MRRLTRWCCVLMLAFVCIGHVEAQTPAPSSAPQTAQPAAPETSDQPFLQEYRGVQEASDGQSTAWLMLKMVLNLVLVLGMGYGGLLLLRRYLFRDGAATMRRRHMAVIESLPLGGGKHLHLVQLGNRVLVVGSSPTSLTSLAGPIEPDSVGIAVSAPDFASTLAQAQQGGVSGVLAAGIESLRRRSEHLSSNPQRDRRDD